MTTAFQSNAFQQNAFQIDGTPPPIIVVDTHDGDAHRKRRFDDERHRTERKKADVLRAFERLIEGRVDVEEVIPEYVTEVSAKAQTPRLDIDRLMADFNAVEALWEAYMEMDDMDALRALGLQ